MSLPQSLFRFPTVRRLLSWRFVRAALFVLACLITLLALFYAEENFRGKRAWDAYVKQQKAKGGKFSLSDFIPPPVPDDQNLALCPLLKPVLALEFHRITEGPMKGQRTKTWLDTNGLARLQRLSRTWSVVEYHEQRPFKDGERKARADLANKLCKLLETPMLTNGWIDLAGWQSYYRTGTNLSNAEASNSPARDVLLALRYLEPDLAELEQEAARRPLARWPIFYDTNNPPNILLPHLAPIKRSVALLQLRASALFATGDTEGGLADIRLGMRFAESVREEPFLISHLVRNACYGLLIQPLKEGMARHQFSELQLALLQKESAKVDLLAAYDFAMRAERGWHTEWNRFFKDSLHLGGPKDFASSLQSVIEINRVGLLLVFAPSGWIYRNQIALGCVYDEYFLGAVDVSTRRVNFGIAESAGPAIDRMSGLFSVLAKEFAPVRSAVRKFAHDQTKLDQMLIALALERYRLAQGSYPESLQATVPRYLEKIPHDLISGQPVKYSVTGQGSYSLSATGWPKKPTTENGERYDASVPDANEWVWRLPEPVLNP